MKRSKHPLPKPWLALIGAACCLLPVTTAAPLPAERSPTDIERERFLQQARIGDAKIITGGVTAPLRATLSQDGFTHDAHIQKIDETLKRFQTSRRTYANFRDSYKYNIAAYRLDRLLGLNMVPVSVERVYHGKKAAVTWWIDDVLMTDAERYEKEIPPPDLESWNDQKHQARVFNQLICNEDPNLGNFLIGTDWKLWMVDFTRAFRRHKELQEPRLLQRIDRRLYDGLRALDLEALRRETAPHLTRQEMKAILARRDTILEVLAARIAESSEAAVICELPGH